MKTSTPPSRTSRQFSAPLVRSFSVALLAAATLVALPAGAAPRGPGGHAGYGDGACDGPMMGFMGGPGDMMGGMMHGMGPGGMGGMGPGAGMASPEQIQDRAGKMAKHMAVEVNATPEQTAKLENIARAAAKDLAPLRAQMRESHQSMHAALKAAKIDRAQVESLRAEHMKLADAASRRMTQAIADAAEVLTPDQREMLEKHLAQRRQHRHGPRR